MSDTTAWLLNFTGNHRAAVGKFQMAHVIPDSPRLFEIPRTPVYCRYALNWNDTIIPVMNLGERLDGVAKLAESTDIGDCLVGIVAFQAKSDQTPLRGGLVLEKPPTRVRVSDTQGCDLPPELQGWRPLTSSCFQAPGLGVVPILDLSRVFGTCPEYSERSQLMPDAVRH